MDKWIIEYYDGNGWHKYGIGVLRDYKDARAGCERLEKAGWIVRVRKAR